MSFTWVPIYNELAQKLLQYQNRQEELLDLLREIAKQVVVGVLGSTYFDSHFNYEIKVTNQDLTTPQEQAFVGLHCNRMLESGPFA
jgi:hypothetical protein